MSLNTLFWGGLSVNIISKTEHYTRIMGHCCFENRSHKSLVNKILSIDKLLHGMSQFFFIKQAQMRFVSYSTGFILLINNDYIFCLLNFRLHTKNIIFEYSTQVMWITFMGPLWSLAVWMIIYLSVAENKKLGHSAKHSVFLLWKKEAMRLKQQKEIRETN